MPVMSPKSYHELKLSEKGSKVLELGIEYELLVPNIESKGVLSVTLEPIRMSWSKAMDPG